MYTFDENTVSDLHKDAYGFRPSQGFWQEWQSSSADEKQDTWDHLINAADAAAAEERAQLDAATHDFEMRVLSLQHHGAKSREMAVRWIVETLDLTEGDLMYGGEYVCYVLGLPYTYGKEFDAALEGRVGV